eukprot:TRINITY_DN50787_c0_g1_i1.p1 TRINITY_DN50787_c0_g1~~TRINITY_DN50787_c0_g1_i1.p1  ORF type:complete len:306 (+),score=42.99 TRINITY_DN50787_c0_g1_i1:145-1062(+)
MCIRDRYGEAGHRNMADVPPQPASLNGSFFTVPNQQDATLPPPQILQMPLAAPPPSVRQPNYGQDPSLHPSVQPLFVNPKQYHRILIRRKKRAREATKRSPYIHESRHRHAVNRPRNPDGSFVKRSSSQPSDGGSPPEAPNDSEAIGVERVRARNRGYENVPLRPLVQRGQEGQYQAGQLPVAQHTVPCAGVQAGWQPEAPARTTTPAPQLPVAQHTITPRQAAAEPMWHTCPTGQLPVFQQTSLGWSAPSAAPVMLPSLLPVEDCTQSHRTAVSQFYTAFQPIEMPFATRPGQQPQWFSLPCAI